MKATFQEMFFSEFDFLKEWNGNKKVHKDRGNGLVVRRQSLVAYSTDMRYLLIYATQKSDRVWVTGSPEKRETHTGVTSQ